jgi:hypothetical protein
MKEQMRVAMDSSHGHKDEEVQTTSPSLDKGSGILGDGLPKKPSTESLQQEKIAKKNSRDRLEPLPSTQKAAPSEPVSKPAPVTQAPPPVQQAPAAPVPPKAAPPARKPEIDERKVLRSSIEGPANKILQNLKRELGTQVETNELKALKMNYVKIKEMYTSFDSAKMTSTIINLDIEEMCYCLASALMKHLEFGIHFDNDFDDIPFQPGREHLDHIAEENDDDEHSGPAGRYEQDGEGENGLNEEEEEEWRYQMRMREELMRLKKQMAEYEAGQEGGEEGEGEGGASPKKKRGPLPKKLSEEQHEEGDSVAEEIIQQNPQYFSGMGMVKEKYIKTSLGKISEKTFEASQTHQDLSGHEDLKKAAEKPGGKPEGDEEYDMDFAESQREVEDILRESLVNLKKSDDSGEQIQQVQLLGKGKATQNFDEIEERGPDPRAGGQPPPPREEYKNEDDEVSFESKFTYCEPDPYGIRAKLEFDEAFKDRVSSQELEQNRTVMPPKETLANYCKNIIQTSKMEREVPIVCLVYIERLILGSRCYLTPNNWRRIVFCALILASKIWDDESYENQHFAKAFPSYTTSDLNDMESVFLKFIDYQLGISSGDYAKYYFILRTFTEKNKRSFPLKPLDIATILFLQKNSNKAMRSLRDQYANPLDKTM